MSSTEVPSRAVLRQLRHCSTDCFHATMRKRCASLVHRVRGSDNTVLAMIANRLDCPYIQQCCGRHITAVYFPTPICPRMLGYTVSLAVHVTNVVHITNTFQGDVLKDPDVRRFHEDGYKFLTVWNVLMQIFYSALSLSCDVLSLINEGKDCSLLKTLKKVRDPVFSSIIFPFSFTVPSLFWTVYLYERSLMLPPSVDNTLSGTANHIIHTAIVPIVLWEIVFRPRTAPKSHVPNLVLMYSYTTAYLTVLVTSYIILGTWVYPILNLLDGTVYLYLFLGTAVILVQIFYCLQWYLTYLVWDNSEEMKKVN